MLSYRDKTRLPVKAPIRVLTSFWLHYRIFGEGLFWGCQQGLFQPLERFAERKIQMDTRTEYMKEGGPKTICKRRTLDPKPQALNPKA